ncbi:hypothetical protein V501_02668 [Pseudogymnoascus sp. VKM F-4519 (FW-2642)]|nr:hypothetical protein V501_02668 [Pseudogymnoascus sp. VKM F-4519 (FW-2642)]
MSQSDFEPSPPGLHLGQKRKRVARACDKCSQSKARCDGRSPCQHCEEYGYHCAYTREWRKRGRRSEAVNSKRAANGSLSPVPSIRQQVNPTQRTNQVDECINANESARPDAGVGSKDGHTSTTESLAPSPEGSCETSTMQVRPLTTISNPNEHIHHSDGSQIRDCGIHHYGHEANHVNINPFFGDLASGLDTLDGKDFGAPYTLLNQFEPPSIQSAREDAHVHSQIQDFQCSLGSTAAISHSTDTDATDQYSTSLRGQEPPTTLSTLNSHCRYSILSPLIPYIQSFISISEACDLLDLYFTEPCNSLFGCASPFVITQIFRKNSFLKNDRPRKTSRALLTAMLWVTAQTSDSPTFTDDPCARSLICGKLYVLCLESLSLQAPYEAVHSNPRGSQNIPQPPSRTLDDVLTFSLIGLVVSGRESRKDCLTWWDKARALARELNLNVELEDISSISSINSVRIGTWPPVSGSDDILANEESREERRRVWWLLYIADRHLALCYNTPLKILDVECHVYQPLDEVVWQNLESYLKAGRLPARYLGASSTMTGAGLFEFFLPVAAILGDIIDIHHQRFHPRLGLLDRNSAIMEIENSLVTYETSLRAFEESVVLKHPDIGQALSHSSPQTIFDAYRDIRPWPCEVTRLKTVIGYSHYLLHVLYILLHGDWDPLSMLDGVDPWVMPRSFATCATKTIAAASAVSEILKVDPELSFMPYLFGVYLLHGSFTLLIFADRMDLIASDTVSCACETIIRAHEICVTTLNTEYQVRVHRFAMEWEKIKTYKQPEGVQKGSAIRSE